MKVFMKLPGGARFIEDAVVTSREFAKTIAEYIKHKLGPLVKSVIALPGLDKKDIQSADAFYVCFLQKVEESLEVKTYKDFLSLLRENLQALNSPVLKEDFLIKKIEFYANEYISLSAKDLIVRLKEFPEFYLNRLCSFLNSKVGLSPSEPLALSLRKYLAQSTSFTSYGEFIQSFCKIYKTFINPLLKPYSPDLGAMLQGLTGMVENLVKDHRQPHEDASEEPSQSLDEVRNPQPADILDEELGQPEVEEKEGCNSVCR
ncbi:hypothetical protein RLOatenuis_2210 [Rickettsiales bacterium]|nr:hypothetical protein RLOatenuis_2210 [Rickettsiales bacterium]